MTSATTFPRRLTKIDDLTRPDHTYLTAGDRCYFLGEYTARKGYAFSATNNLVLNFKKSMTTRGQAQWRYKDQAISQAAAAFRAAVNEEALNNATFIPVPPSKAKSDPLYDDRLVKMLRRIRPSPPVDIRELVVQIESTRAVHDSETRPSPAELESRYTLDQTLLSPTPQLIVIVDDVLTTGAHFRAVKAVLERTFPGVSVIGLFIARRVPEAVDIEDFDL